jgi:hypothetical protein
MLNEQALREAKLKIMFTPDRQEAMFVPVPHKGLAHHYSWVSYKGEDVGEATSYFALIGAIWH